MPIKLKRSEFEAYQELYGLGESECAIRMDISPSQLWKVKKGIHDPGEGFIAGALSLFAEASFDDLFFLPGVLRVRDGKNQILPKTG